MTDIDKDDQLIAQLGLWADELAGAATPFTVGDLGQPVVVPLTARRRRPNTLWWGMAAAAAVAVAVLAWRPWADDSRQIVPADTTIATVPITVPAPSTTDAPTSTDAPTPTEVTTATAEAEMTTVPVLTEPVVITDGAFLGIDVGTLRADGLVALQQFGRPILAEANPKAHLCGVGLAYSDVSTVGGLSVKWDGASADDAVLTNWWYSGQDVDGQPQMVTAEGITVGSTQSDVMQAYPGVEVGTDTEVMLPGFHLEMTAGVVTGMGHVDCGD